MSGIVFAETTLRELNNLAGDSQRRKSNDMYGAHLHSCGKMRKRIGHGHIDMSGWGI